MAIILNQTNTALTFQVGCSADPAGATNAARQLIEGGTLGTTEMTLDPGNNVERTLLVFRTSGGLGETTWQAGNFVVRINVSTSNGTNTWTDTYICERTAAGTFNTVASLTGQALNVSTTGIKTMTVNRGTNFTPVAADSDLFIAIVIRNNDQHGNSKISITPNQQIDTPITASVAPPTASGGSEVSISVSSEGLGIKGSQGGSTVTVSTSQEGLGFKGSSGGSEATVGVSSEGAGEVLEIASGGSESTISVSSEGVGIKQARSPPSESSVGISLEGNGSKQISQGSEGSVIVSEEGAGSPVIEVSAPSPILGTSAHVNGDTSSLTETLAYDSGTGGNDRCLIAVVTTENGKGAPSNVTYGGQAMTLLHFYPNPAPAGTFMEEIRVYYLLNPPTGSNTFSATFGTTSFDWSYQLTTFENVHQTNPFGTPVEALYNEPDTTATVDVTTTQANSSLFVTGVINGTGCAPFTMIAETSELSQGAQAVAVNLGFVYYAGFRENLATIGTYTVGANSDSAVDGAPSDTLVLGVEVFGSEAGAPTASGGSESNVSVSSEGAGNSRMTLQLATNIVSSLTVVPMLKETGFLQANPTLVEQFLANLLQNKNLESVFSESTTLVANSASFQDLVGNIESSISLLGHLNLLKSIVISEEFTIQIQGNLTSDSQLGASAVIESSAQLVGTLNVLKGLGSSTEFSSQLISNIDLIKRLVGQSEANAQIVGALTVLKVLQNIITLSSEITGNATVDFGVSVSAVIEASLQFLGTSNLQKRLNVQSDSELQLIPFLHQRTEGSGILDNQISISGMLTSVQELRTQLSNSFIITGELTSGTILRLSATTTLSSGIIGEVRKSSNLQSDILNEIALESSLSVWVDMESGIGMATGTAAELKEFQTLSSELPFMSEITGSLSLFDAFASLLGFIKITESPMFYFKIEPQKSFQTKIKAQDPFIINIEES